LLVEEWWKGSRGGQVGGVGMELLLFGVKRDMVVTTNEILIEERENVGFYGVAFR